MFRVIAFSSTRENASFIASAVANERPRKVSLSHILNILKSPCGVTLSLDSQASYMCSV